VQGDIIAEQQKQHNGKKPLYLLERQFPSPAKDPSNTKLQEAYRYLQVQISQFLLVNSLFPPLKGWFQCSCEYTLAFPELPLIQRPI